MVAKIRFLPLMRFVAGSAFEKPSLIQLTAMAALSRVAAIHQVELLRSHTNGRFAQAALRGVGQKLAIGWGRECPLTFFFDENPSIILNRDVSRSGKVDGAIADQTNRNQMLIDKDRFAKIEPLLAGAPRSAVIPANFTVASFQACKLLN